MWFSKVVKEKICFFCTCIDIFPYNFLYIRRIFYFILIFYSKSSSEVSGLYPWTPESKRYLYICSWEFFLSGCNPYFRHKTANIMVTPLVLAVVVSLYTFNKKVKDKKKISLQRNKPLMFVVNERRKKSKIFLSFILQIH